MVSKLNKTDQLTNRPKFLSSLESASCLSLNPLHLSLLSYLSQMQNGYGFQDLFQFEVRCCMSRASTDHPSVYSSSIPQLTVSEQNTFFIRGEERVFFQRE